MDHSRQPDPAPAPARSPPAGLEAASSFKRAAISRLLPAEAEGPAAGGGGGGAPDAPGEEGRRRTELVSGVVGSLTFAGFEPAWQRPRPPVLTPAAEELRWLAPPLGQELLWDTTAGDDPGRLAVRLGGEAGGRRRAGVGWWARQGSRRATVAWEGPARSPGVGG